MDFNNRCGLKLKIESDNMSSVSYLLEDHSKTPWRLLKKDEGRILFNRRTDRQREIVTP